MTSTTALVPTIHKLYVQHVTDEDPDTSYLEQDEFAERLAEYRNDDFYFIGVQAVAELRFATPQGGWENGPKVVSPGLWGIESDSGAEYLAEIENEQKNELREMLEALNVSADEIERTFSTAWIDTDGALKERNAARRLSSHQQERSTACGS